MPVYKSEVSIKSSREVLYSFFLTPNNLPEVTVPELKLNIIQAPEAVEAGSVVKFSVTQIGQEIHSEHEVIVADGETITEKQVKGVMKSWQHERKFVAVSESECRIENTIDFEGPTGLVGVIMNEQRIRKMLGEGFDYQNEKLKEKFDGAGS